MFGPLLRFASPWYARLLAWRQLDGVWIRGLENASYAAAEGPIILAANHVCWWDGQIMLILHQVLGLDAKFLVNADNVDRLSFLAPLGAIPLDRSTISTTMEAMETAARWLTGPRKSVWLFPQGRFRPTHVRPLGIHRGVAVLHKWSDGAPIVPVAMQYGYLDNHLPACAILIGEPLRGRERLAERLEEALTQQLDELTTWFDTPERREEMAPFVRSMVVPIERRPGAMFYLYTSAAVRWLWRRVVPRRD